MPAWMKTLQRATGSTQPPATGAAGSDTVTANSTMDTINSSGSYTGGSVTTTVNSGENIIGTAGHTDGNYYNSATSASSSTADGGAGTAG